MPNWQGSDRRERLPPDWERTRKRILRRDGNRCTHRDQYGDRCQSMATDVDHIVAGDNHDDSNLRALCAFHHQKKSSSEGAAARARAQWRNKKRFSRAEQHPGLL